MIIYTINPGVVLAEIHGIFLLVADKAARKSCPYIREINELGAFIWRTLEKQINKDDLVRLICQEYDIPINCSLETDIEVYLQSLIDLNYITKIEI